MRAGPKPGSEPRPPGITQGHLGGLDMPRNRALHWNPSAQRLPIARFRREGSPIRRILFATAHPYLDDTNGAAVASRAMMESLSRSGFAVEALSGMGPNATENANPAPGCRLAASRLKRPPGPHGPSA